MDPNTQPIGGQVPGVQPQAGQPQGYQQPYQQQPYQQQPYQPQYDPTPYPNMVPMPDGWAAGVSPVMVVPSRSHRGRWAIAGAVVLIVALLTAGGAFVLSGAGGQKSLTASFAPKNALVFIETRVDLPGDQHAKLADFMNHFPGFQDRALFDTALDKMLDRLTFAGANLSYTTDFKPWMQGEVSLALVDEGPQVSTGSVVIFAIKDRAGAEKWAASLLARGGTSFTNQDYAGTKIYATGSAISDEAYAVTDQDLFVGTTAGVKSALDSKTSGSLADNSTYQAAMKSLAGDAIARIFIDTQRLAAMDTSGNMTSAMGLGVPASISAKNLPAWIAGSIRAESDRAVLTITMPRVAQNNLGIGNHSSTLASHLPGSSVAVSETHSIGKSIAGAMPMLESQPGMNSSSGLAQVKDVISKIGGTDWIGDGAVVLTKDGATLGGGVVVEAPDAATASFKESSITNLVTLAGAAYHLTSRDETYKGVTVTLITVPADVTGGTPIEIAVAAKDDLIVAGYTDAFVKAVIDTTPSNSLASQADYSKVMAQAGSNNEESFYVNVPAVEDQIGQIYSPSRWASDYKPYFDHLGGVAGSVIDGDTVTLRIVISAR